MESRPLSNVCWSRARNDCGVLTATCPLPDLTGVHGATFEYREGSIPLEEASCSGTP